MMEIQQQPNRNEPTRQPAGFWLPIGIGAVLVIALIAAAVAVFRVDTWGEKGNGLSPRFSLDVDAALQVDPALDQYAETGAIPLDMTQVRAVAAGADGVFCVAGDRAIQVFGPDGTLRQTIAVAGRPTCVAIAGPTHAVPGRFYAGSERKIEVFDAQGRPAGTWEEGLDAYSMLTSIAVSDEDVFVADASSRLIWHYDAEGKLLGRIGQPDELRGIPGFVIPSGYFDVAVSADGLLRVANTGARRIETYTLEGDLLGQWGTESPLIEGFFGCCNPANFALLPDQRFVTVEKGIPRVKIYDKQGRFQCVVASPQTLVPGGRVGREIREDHETDVFDVAVDSDGRVLILDSSRRAVRIFVRKEPS